MCDKSQDFFVMESSEGRIHLVLRVFRIGRDLSVILTGGQPHVGGVALAARGKTDMLELAGHHDGGVARQMASKLAQRLDCAVAVACGIHYDGITREEIAFVVRQTDIFTQALLCALNRKKSC